MPHIYGFSFLLVTLDSFLFLHYSYAFLCTYTVHILYMQTVGALACVLLLFLSCDTKCCGPNWGVCLARFCLCQRPKIACRLKKMAWETSPCALLLPLDLFSSLTQQNHYSVSDL